MGFASGVVDADLCSFRPLDILDGNMEQIETCMHADQGLF
jgi:hypothetical protein